MTRSPFGKVARRMPGSLSGAAGACGGTADGARKLANPKPASANPANIAPASASLRARGARDLPMDMLLKIAATGVNPAPAADRSILNCPALHCNVSLCCSRPRGRGEKLADEQGETGAFQD